MSRVRVAKREMLASKKNMMGCPQQLKYPLDTKKRVIAAGRYYLHKRTQKCKGFWSRWCKRAKQVGWKKDLFEMKCTPKGNARKSRRRRKR